MGISRESLGQIRDILRKLDNSIDSAREKRLKENEHRRGDASSDGAPNGAETNGAGSANGLERRAG